MDIEQLRRYERTVNYGETMKPLDLADTYAPASYEDPYVDEEPTIKMQAFKYEVMEEEEEEVDERGFVKFPGVGLLLALSFGAIFWILMYSILVG